MKPTFCALLLMAMVAFVLTGCSDDSYGVVSPSERTTVSVSSATGVAKMGDCLHSATGSGHFREMSIFSESKVRASFTAIQHTNGTYSGNLVWKGMYDQTNYYFKATVLNVHVTGNQAKVAVVFERTSQVPPGPNMSDFHGWFVVVDNGDGTAASGPDIVTPFFWDDGTYLIGKTVEEVDNMDVDAFLAWLGNVQLPAFDLTLEQFLMPIDRGDVHVR